MIADFKYAFRLLVKSPAFTAIAVLTLALGIGANTAIFTVVNGVLLRQLPYPEAQRLVAFKSNQSAPELEDMETQSRSFEAIGGISRQAADYSGGGEPVQLQLGLVTGDFFRVFGARTILGRTITPEEARFGGPSVLVLSHSVWQREFGGDRSVLGRTIAVAGQSYTVIGVTAPDFRAPRGEFDAYAAVHVFYPLAAKSRGAHLLRTYALLRSGVTLADAQSEQRVLDGRFAEAYPDENKGRQTTLLSLHERLVGDVRPALLVLLGAVGLLLVIACANFANLLLVRVEAQRPELMIRAALGASRGRLIRQVLSESLLLALLGGVAGLLLGSWGVDALLALRPADLPRVESISVDGQVLAFTFGLAVLTGLVFGFLPAWQATRSNGQNVVPTSSRTATAGRSSLRMGLVVAELSLALVLLTGAGLLGKTFWRLTSVAPGFEADHLLALRVELPEARYKDIPAQTRFREQVLQNINESPGLQAAMISELPLGGNSINHNFVIEGRPPMEVGDEPELYSRSVAGDYFKVMGIPLQRGRAFARDDRAEAPLVGVINESMARQYFPEQDPIGARIRWARDEGVSWITIIGVVGDVQHFGFAQSEAAAIYTPYAQSGQEWKRWSEVVVRTPAGTDRQRATAALKQLVWKADALIPVKEVRSMDEVMAVSLAERRFNALLLGVFAGVALLLATVGLYGVLAFSVAQRTREIGIRMALGAQRADMLALVFRQSLLLVALGLTTGVLASLAGTRLLKSLLHGVGTNDTATYAFVVVVLSGAALLASYLPARRAMRVDPMVALRHE